MAAKQFGQQIHVTAKSTCKGEILEVNKCANRRLPEAFQVG